VPLAERLTALFAAVAALLTGTELLALRREFRSGGLADPAIATAPRQYVLVRRMSVAWMPILAGLEIALAVAIPSLILAALPVVVPVTLLAAVIAVAVAGSTVAARAAGPATPLAAIIPATTAPAATPPTIRIRYLPRAVVEPPAFFQRESPMAAGYG